jgi:hypothetical protein
LAPETLHPLSCSWKSRRIKCSSILWVASSTVFKDSSRARQPSGLDFAPETLAFWKYRRRIEVHFGHICLSVSSMNDIGCSFLHEEYVVYLGRGVSFLHLEAYAF